jgi:hypothetical protein
MLLTDADDTYRLEVQCSLMQRLLGLQTRHFVQIVLVGPKEVRERHSQGGPWGNRASHEYYCGSWTEQRGLSVAKGTLDNNKQRNKQTPWSESASELHRPSERRLSAEWLPTFEDRGCHMVSVTDPYGRILGFLDRSRYFSIKQLLSCTHEAGWTPFQTHYFFFCSGSAGNRNWASESVAKNSDH